MKSRIKGLLLSIFLLTFVCTSAMQGGIVILVKGTVKNESGGSPLETKINFIDSKGKKVTCRSNSTNGTYQAVLPSGESYFVLIDNFMNVSSSQMLNIPEYKEYVEINHDITGRKYEAGMEISRFSCFEPNSASISSSGMAYLNAMKELIKTNMKIVMKVTVSTSDSWFSDTKKKVQVETTNKKGKKTKSTKSVKVTSREQLEELAQTRIAALQQFLRDNGIREKSIEFVTDIRATKPKAPAKTKGKKQASSGYSASSPNITLTIQRILNL